MERAPRRDGFMKRWVFLSLALILVVASISIFLIHAHFTAPPVVATKSHLMRVPNSAFKYHLCTEAYAYAMASASNPYKTDYSFPDPFRHGEDTIIPRYLGLDKQGDGASFSMKIIIDQVATFNETIANIHGRDGISILLPDGQNQLQHSSVPQLIITLPDVGASIAVLDYTCPEQWVWS